MKQCFICLGLLQTFLLQGVVGQTFLRVGSWNLQNLGERDWGQHPKAIAELLYLSGVDVVALQEIHDTDGVVPSRTNTRLNQAFETLSKEAHHQWKYVLFPKRDPMDVVQLTGVAWNQQRCKMVGRPYRVPVKYGRSEAIWKRHPYAVKFQTEPGKSDFVLICVHMKSNRGDERFGRAQRLLEAKALTKALRSITEHFDDSDLIILGDTNCLDSDEEALQVFYRAGFRDLNRRDQSTYAHRDSPLDRILVPQTQREFTFSKQYVLSPSDPKAYLSAFPIIF